MAVLAETNKSNTFTYDENTKMKLLLKTLDDALDAVSYTHLTLPTIYSV